MQTDIAQNLLKMQNHSSECVFRTLITPEINYLGFGMHIDRFGTSFEIRKIGLKKSLCCESEPECLGVIIFSKNSLREMQYNPNFESKIADISLNARHIENFEQEYNFYY